MDKSIVIFINFYNFLYLYKDGKKMSKNVYYVYFVRIKIYIRRNVMIEEC